MSSSSYDLRSAAAIAARLRGPRGQQDEMGEPSEATERRAYVRFSLEQLRFGAPSVPAPAAEASTAAPLRADLAEKDARIVELREELAGMAPLRAELVDKDARIAKLQEQVSQLGEASASMAPLRAELGVRSVRIAELEDQNAKLGETSASLAPLRAEVGVKGAKIAELEGQISKLGETSASLASVKDARIAELEEQVSAGATAEGADFTTSLPTSIASMGSAGWDRMLDWCVEALSADAAVIVDGGGLLVGACCGKLTIQEIEETSARLSMVFEHTDQVLPRHGATESVTIGLDQGWLTGVRIPYSNELQFIVGVASSRPLSTQARATVVEAFAEKARQ